MSPVQKETDKMFVSGRRELLAYTPVTQYFLMDPNFKIGRRLQLYFQFVTADFSLENPCIYCC